MCVKRSKIEFSKEEDKQIEQTLKNLEGKENLQYEWIDINEIDQYPILPKAVKSILKESNYPLHKINIDI